MTERLIGDVDLESSDVVANSAMNRQRGLAGENSYEQELGFHPLERLRSVPSAGAGVAWLDLCCGTGRALVEAAAAAPRYGLSGLLTVVGVDLVDFFWPVPEGVAGVELVVASATSWAPPAGLRFDLITCVHGLHYVGDKLGLLARAAGWLAPDGLLVADLEPASVRRADGTPAGRRLTTALRAAGFECDTRRRRVTLAGGRSVTLPYRYAGADDRAGPNYTGQPAVHSYYEELA